MSSESNSKFEKEPLPNYIEENEQKIAKQKSSSKKVSAEIINEDKNEDNFLNPEEDFTNTPHQPPHSSRITNLTHDHVISHPDTFVHNNPFINDDSNHSEILSSSYSNAFNVGHSNGTVDTSHSNSTMNSSTTSSSSMKKNLGFKTDYDTLFQILDLLQDGFFHKDAVQIGAMFTENGVWKAHPQDPTKVYVGHEQIVAMLNEQFENAQSVSMEYNADTLVVDQNRNLAAVEWVITTVLFDGTSDHNKSQIDKSIIDRTSNAVHMKFDNNLISELRCHSMLTFFQEEMNFTSNTQHDEVKITASHNVLKSKSAVGSKISSRKSQKKKKSAQKRKSGKKKKRRNHKKDKKNKKYFPWVCSNCQHSNIAETKNCTNCNKSFKFDHDLIIEENDKTFFHNKSENPQTMIQHPREKEKALNATEKKTTAVIFSPEDLPIDGQITPVEEEEQQSQQPPILHATTVLEENPHVLNSTIGTFTSSSEEDSPVHREHTNDENIGGLSDHSHDGEYQNSDNEKKSGEETHEGKEDIDIIEEPHRVEIEIDGPIKYI